MGLPTTPQDAAPAYDDVFGDHPVNRYTPSGSASAYAAVPQDEDVELHAHAHDHSHTTPSPAPGSSIAPQPESLVQTIAGVFKPKPHVHCEQCDVQMAARQRRENEKHCCNMVAATFMVGFVCAFIFGVILTSIIYRHKRGD
ncbi:hypothetical protein FB567DRAFT_275494 [Paraphoma chrysanthemicola]|uniref:LITAF domain-containing protein n=1 Tax=Paraphoma chrysanthemicola TaxID=798071 RepID=A0A8K0RCF0_9PLEO|nr:hypothetical protein FB567DRAFT_275494 [Paraphoma chrysanthemicola]